MLKKLLIFLFAGTMLTACDDEDQKESTASSVGYTINGHISVAGNTAKDTDVNDKNALYTSNDAVGLAQPIPNPVILGGYVNQAGKGPAGSLKTSGDVNDYYRVDLLAGQQIQVFVANENPSGNDVDLALLNESGLVLNASVGETETESLKVPANGRYFVQVRAFRGASNYVLSIGQDLQANHKGLHLNDAFSTGEVIVKFKPQDTISIQNTMSRMANLGLHTQQQDTSQRMLFTFDLASQRTLTTDDMQFESPLLQEKYETLLTIKTLRQRQDIADASPNYHFTALKIPNDQLYRYQWDYPLMQLPQAWDITTGDANVIVAVIDTGVLLNHPDLRGKLVEGYDFVADTNISLDGDGYDPNPDDPGDRNPGGSSFHGTHVAGTIGALTNNGKGVSGVGWSTRIMPLRVLGKGGGGKDYNIEQAIRFAAGLPNASKTLPNKPVDIINLSLGGPTISDSFQGTIDEVRRQGIIVVAAAGNDGTNTPIYPASLNGVISVSAIDINRARTSYSNYGNYVDIAAPGGDNATADINGDGNPDLILSTHGNDEHNTMQFDYVFSMGTSMASPHIAGVIALMKAVNPHLTPADMDDLISSGQITEDLGTQGRDDNFGHGFIDAQKAVLAASQLGGGVIVEPTPLLVVSHRALNFGLGNTRIRLSLSNGGSGHLQINEIQEDSGGFLSIIPQVVTPNTKLGDYVVSVDRQQLRPGTFTATITFISNVNTVKVPVILQVGDQTIDGDAGLHYVLLIEADSLETVSETRTTVAQGIYDFRFSNVAPGTYIIAAGSDFNNDGFICDLGEACGAFLTLANPSNIEVTNYHHNQIDFSTGFNVSFLSQLSVLGGTPIPAKGFARLRPIKMLK